MTRIKICGLTRMEDICAVNKYKPDYIGFVFAKTSRRYVHPKDAAVLKQHLSADIAAVGVFVNEPMENIADLLEQKIIDLAQLHGRETEAEVRWLKNRTKRQVIQAVSVKSKADAAGWEGSSADYLLFDSGPGGTGETFDWTCVADCEKPYFLAGGINMENLERALATGAYAIDLSGGAETGGYKDPDKIADIVRTVREFGN